MNFEWIIVFFLIGSAVGWLVNRAIRTFKARKKGGCAGGCQCSTKIHPPRD